MYDTLIFQVLLPVAVVNAKAMEPPGFCIPVSKYTKENQL